MQKKTDDELETEMRLAYQRLPDTCVFKHVKTGREYFLKDLAFEESTLRIVALYGNGRFFTFTRPLDEFLDKFTPVVR